MYVRGIGVRVCMYVCVCVCGGGMHACMCVWGGGEGGRRGGIVEMVE